MLGWRTDPNLGEVLRVVLYILRVDFANLTGRIASDQTGLLNDVRVFVWVESPQDVWKPFLNGLKDDGEGAGESWSEGIYFEISV